MISAIVVESVFGHTVKALDDQYVQLAKEFTNAVTDAAAPAAMLVDYFPIRESHLANINRWYLLTFSISQVCSIVDARHLMEAKRSQSFCSI